MAARLKSPSAPAWAAFLACRPRRLPLVQPLEHGPASVLHDAQHAKHRRQRADDDPAQGGPNSRAQVPGLQAESAAVDPG
jgi:hypothetical protein